MRYFRTLAIATLLLPGGVLFAASKEQMEMQRDIAQLQDQVRTLQSSVDKNMATLQTLVQQALDVARGSATGVSVLQNSVTQTLERQLRESLTPVAGLAAKVDNTNNDVAEVRNSVADLNVAVNKILQILTDMNNTLKVLQAPPAPPPGSSATPCAIRMGASWIWRSPSMPTSLSFIRMILTAPPLSSTSGRFTIHSRSWIWPRRISTP